MNDTINKIKANKVALENLIASFLQEEIRKFNEENNVTPTSMSVFFHPIYQMGVTNNPYMVVANVSLNISI